MDNNNEKKLSIRPILKNMPLKYFSDEEAFQNKTLRPILKMQNELLLKLFFEQLSKLRINWKELSVVQKQSVLNNLFKTDISFKNALTYIIAGQFTIDEFDCFLENPKIFSKRICQMAKQRIESQVN